MRSLMKEAIEVQIISLSFETLHEVPSQSTMFGGQCGIYIFFSPSRPSEPVERDYHTENLLENKMKCVSKQ